MQFATFGCTLLMAFGPASVEAPSDQAVSTETIRQALRQPQPHALLIPPMFTPETNRSRRFGILSLADPDTSRGEVVKVVVPVGQLTMALARKIAGAQRQRRERKAREQVERALRDFQAHCATK